MTDPYAVKWTDGTGRVKWGVELFDRQQLKRGWGGYLYFGPQGIGTDQAVRFRTKRQAWRVGRKILRRDARSDWTQVDSG